MSKEAFKSFVKNNPSIVDIIKNKKESWQSLYEIYDIYGEDMSVWSKYLNDSKNSFDFMNYLKNIDLDSLEESINSIQRVLGVISDLVPNKTNYEAKPLYKHLDD